LHLLELPKLPDRTARPDDPRVLRWARFLAAKSPKELEHVAMTYPELEDAKESLERLSLDPWVQREARLREHELAHYAYTIRREAQAAEQRGREQGREEGREEARRQLAATVEQVCGALGVEVNEARKRELEQKDVEGLRKLLQHLAERREWPSD